MRIFVRLFVGSVLVSMVFVMFVSRSAEDESLSPGCIEINTSSIIRMALTVNSATSISNTFKAGEIITVEVKQIGGLLSTPSLVQLEVDGPFIVYASGHTPVTFSYVIPNNEERMITLVHPRGNPGGNIVQGNWHCGRSSASNNRPCEIGDGRLNRFDCGALVAIYQNAIQIDVYAINLQTAEGTLVLRLPLADLPSEDVSPTEPLLLGESNSPYDTKPIALYLLPTNELQVNAVNPDDSSYVFIWKRSASFG